MVEKPTVEELCSRIERDVKHFGGGLPERVALVWSGYLAALIEWGLLSVSEHHSLCSLLPKIEDDPAAAILLGRADTGIIGESTIRGAFKPPERH